MTTPLPAGTYGAGTYGTGVYGVGEVDTGPAPTLVRVTATVTVRPTTRAEVTVR